MLASYLAVQTWCPWCGDHHMGWGGTGMMIGWTVLLVVLVVAVWALATRRGRSDDIRPAAGDRAEDIVREQYARGEIDEETYRRRLDELRGS